MQTRFYLRVAKTRYGLKVDASSKPKIEPLNTIVGYPNRKKYYPTVLIAFNLEIPDKEFDKARILLEAKVEETEPLIEIKRVEEGKK